MLTSTPHDNLSIDVSLPPGTRLQQDSFVVNSVLGRGGFGITYHAQGRFNASQIRGGDTFSDNTSDLQTSGLQAVAIKEFFPNGCLRSGRTVQFPVSVNNASASAEQERARQNFLNEARVLAALHHPGIVRVYAAFQENNTAYMVMEFLDGETLQQIVEKRGPLPEDVAVAYIEQVGAALSEVHRANFIHRDIKAENIMICNNGQSRGQAKDARVMLLDFGLNKEISSSDTYHTLRLTNALRFGSPGYSPPEQYGRQARFGPYTDLYALGATLYYLLSGQVPPDAPERMAGEELIPLHQLQPQVSRSVSKTIHWALELKGDDRPQSVREFLNALRQGDPSSHSYATSKVTLNSGPASPMRGQSQTSSYGKPTPTVRAAFRPQPQIPAGRFPASQATKPHRLHSSPRGLRRKLSSYAANSLKRVGQHLWLNFLEVLPRLLLIAALIAGLILFARQKPHAPEKYNQVELDRRNKSGGKKQRPESQ